MSWKLFGHRKKADQEKWNIRTMFGPNLNFAATEAYKLLRTNVMFSFPDEGRGHVVGVTSAEQAEGKSSTACNLAYAIAEAGAKVLLLEADLRRPSVASKLGLARSPGLTNLLVSKEDYRQVLQQCPIAPKLDVIASGDIPPNPSELLGSERMSRLLQELSTQYDYVVVDLPPVTVVSDAVAVSHKLDGIILVTRAVVSDQRMLAEAMRQLKMVDARILGFVYRDIDGTDSKYDAKYKSKNRKYYTEYGKKK